MKHGYKGKNFILIYILILYYIYYPIALIGNNSIKTLYG